MTNQTLGTRGAAAVALILAFTPRTSAAAPPPAAPSPPAQGTSPAAHVIVPPRPLTPLHAEYPAGAQGGARVILVIVVNADGTVRSARAEEGKEPFTSAAVAAASGFRFAPATRDGVAINASIRAEIRFAAPALAPPLEPSPASPGPAPAAPGKAAPSSAGPVPPPVQPIEVNVRGEVIAPGVTSLSRAEVRLLPGAFGDPFRAIEALPGVTPLFSGFPYFYVRGAPPGNVGYFLDGIRVPLLYHLGLGPSVVHPAIVDRVDLYPGGYPARYGHFAGGIVAGETKPALPEAHGEGVLRPFDAGALVEVPFAGGRGAALAGGRYSYTAALLSLIQSQVKLDYWDYQARFSFDLTPRDTIAIFAFGSRDQLGNKSKDARGNEIVTTLFDTSFHRVDLRYTHRLGAESTVRQAVTLGFDQTILPSGSLEFDADGMQDGHSFVRDFSLASRTEIVHRLPNGALLRAGLDATFDRINADLGNGPGADAFNSLFKPQLDIVAGAYAEVVVPVTRRLEVTPGLRLDFYGEGRDGADGATALAVDPRLSSRLAVTRSFRLVQTIGLASQPPSFILPGPGFRLAFEGGLQRSFQSSAGVEADLPEDVFASMTFFQNGFFNLTDALGTNYTTGDAPGGFNTRSLGHALGLEVVVRRRLTRRLGGFLAYTLSRSTRQLGSSDLPTSFDRTHVGNLALSYDFGRGYRAGGRFFFYTGGPRLSQDEKTRGLYVAGRHPAFYRIDVRLEKRWPIGRTGWLSVVLEVLNTTLSKEILSTNCQPDGSCNDESLGPITLPSLGLEGGF